MKYFTAGKMVLIWNCSVYTEDILKSVPYVLKKWLRYFLWLKGQKTYNNQNALRCSRLNAPAGGRRITNWEVTGFLSWHRSRHHIYDSNYIKYGITHRLLSCCQISSWVPNAVNPKSGHLIISTDGCHSRTWQAQSLIKHVHVKYTQSNDTCELMQAVEFYLAKFSVTSAARIRTLLL